MESSLNITEGEVVIRILSEPFPFQKKLNNPTPGGEREELWVFVIEQVVLVSGVCGSVLRLKVVLGEQRFVWVERFLQFLEPGLQPVVYVGEERNPAS